MVIDVNAEVATPHIHKHYIWEAIAIDVGDTDRIQLAASRECE